MNEMHIIVPDTDVKRFLDNVMMKISLGHFYVRSDRDVNIQALVDLGINALQREEWVKKLRVKHYSHCYIPQDEEEISLYNGNLWVFGIKVKKTEVYVKIALGRFNSDSICISFHPAIHSLDYPYKNSKL